MIHVLHNIAIYFGTVILVGGTIGLVIGLSKPIKRKDL